MNPLTSNFGPDTDADLDTILSIVPFLLIGLTLLFLPTLIAIARKHERRKLILLINLLRGGIPGVSMELLQMNRLSTRPIAKASHGTITLGVFNALSRGMVFLGVNLVAICVLSSCSVARTVHSQSDFDALPPNTGDYGGSFPVQTWSYMGSDERYDHFIYTPTRDNMPKPTRVRVVRGLVALDFEPQPYPLPNDGFPLVPQFSEGRIIGFSAETNATRLRRDVLESNDTFKPKSPN